MTVLIPFDIESILNCIHDWFSGSTGLEVVWADQSAPRPEYPYGTLKLSSGPVSKADSWEERYKIDLTRPLGQEVEIEVNSPCQFTISAQTFIDGEDSINPIADARSYLLSALAALNLPMFQELFEEVNIAVVRAEAIRDLTALVGTARQSRAAMDIVFSSVLTAEEFVGYIEKAHLTSTDLGIDRTFGVGEEI
jgi:hypothetical protein